MLGRAWYLLSYYCHDVRVERMVERFKLGVGISFSVVLTNTNYAHISQMIMLQCTSSMDQIRANLTSETSMVCCWRVHFQQFSLT